MSKEEIKKAIQDELQKRKVKVLNKNAIKAFFGAFADPVGSLAQVFLGRQEALDAENQKIAQDLALGLLIKIDGAISELKESSKQAGIYNIIEGTIEVHGDGSEEVIGVHIQKGSRATELKPGTHIKTSGSGARSVTGLKIGN